MKQDQDLGQVSSGVTFQRLDPSNLCNFECHICMFALWYMGWALKCSPATGLVNTLSVLKNVPRSIHVLSIALKTTILVLNTSFSLPNYWYTSPSSLFLRVGVAKETDQISVSLKHCLKCLGDRTEWATAGSLSQEGGKVRLHAHVTSAINQRQGWWTEVSVTYGPH